MIGPRRAASDPWWVMTGRSRHDTRLDGPNGLIRPALYCFMPSCEAMHCKASWPAFTFECATGCMHV